MSYLTILREQLPEDEGNKKFPYRCTSGKLSIGIGRNLDDVGVRPDEVALMLENDLSEAVAAAIRVFPTFDTLDDVRKAVVVNMCFNIGATRMAKFKQMIKAVGEKNWPKAAESMENSLWAKQVQKSRSSRLIRMMRTGKL